MPDSKTRHPDVNYGSNQSGRWTVVSWGSEEIEYPDLAPGRAHPRYTGNQLNDVL